MGKDLPVTRGLRYFSCQEPVRRAWRALSSNRHKARVHPSPLFRNSFSVVNWQVWVEMLSKMSGRTAVLSLLVGVLACFANGKETMGERAQSVRERRSQMANVKAPRLQERDETSFRYLSNATERMFDASLSWLLTNNVQAYKVDALPDIDFDVGELYGGQIAVGNDTSKQMFFMFEPTIGEPVDEVTIWFNGGPGCSSLEAFLQENGRFICT